MLRKIFVTHVTLLLMLLCYFCFLEWMSIYFLFLIYSHGSSIKQLKEKEKEKGSFSGLKIMHVLGEILESTIEKVF